MSTAKGINTKVVAAGVSSANKETDTKTVVLRVLFYLLVAAIIVFNLFPFVWALLSSFRPSSELFSTQLIPTQLTLAHFQAVFKDARFVAGVSTPHTNHPGPGPVSLLTSEVFGCSPPRVRFSFLWAGVLHSLVVVLLRLSNL